MKTKRDTMTLPDCGCGGKFLADRAPYQCGNCGRLFGMQNPPKRHVLIIPTTEALLATMRELEAISKAVGFRVSTPIHIDAGVLGCETKDQL